MMALVSTELLKVRTTRSWWGILIGAVVWIGGLSAIAAAFSGQSFDPSIPAPTPEDPDVARLVYTSGLTNFGYVFTMVLGTLIICTEFRHQTVTPTFLATPRRWRAVVAKWVAVALYSLLYGVIFLGISLGLGIAFFAARGFEIDLARSDLWRAMALCLLAFVLWGLIGIGLGTLIGNQIVAILVGIGFVVVELIASGILFFVEWGPDVLKFFPSNATQALISPQAVEGPGQSIELLPWWGGALELVLIAAVFSAVGAALTLRRDVT